MTVEKKELYLSIGNAGAKLELDLTKYGPSLRVSSNAYGNLSNSMEILTNKESLLELAGMLTDFATELPDNHKEYCYLARSLTNVEFGSGEESSVEEKAVDA